MVKIKAYIRFFKNERKLPFYSGYRPLCRFIEGTATSGSIELIDREKFYPGDEGVVKITFLIRECLGNDFAEGKKFTFAEAIKPIGEGVVIEILQ
jgi:translation elongation factor EF-Tu-like GTPase